jgi:hypothetical protein
VWSAINRADRRLLPVGATPNLVAAGRLRSATFQDGWGAAISWQGCCGQISAKQWGARMQEARPVRLRKLEFCGLLLVMTCVGGIVGMSIGIDLRDRLRTPALLNGLSREYVKADREFAERIAHAFPVGSSEVAMTKALEQQGFKPTSGHSPPGQGHAVFDFSNWVCNQKARVWWRTNSAGQITSVQSRYGEEGCL